MNRIAIPRGAGRVRGAGPSPLARVPRPVDGPAVAEARGEEGGVPGHDFGRLAAPDGGAGPAAGSVAVALTRPPSGGGVIQRGRLKRLQRSNQRGLAGKRKRRAGTAFGKCNRMGIKYNKDTTPTTSVTTKFGKFSMSRGRGEGPNILTRKEDFGDVDMKTTYNAVSSAITDGGADDKDVAAEMISHYDDESEDPGTHVSTEKQKRSATFLTGITQISEEKRNPSAAKLARAGLRRISRGRATFKEVFHGDNAAYVPAREKGTGLYRDILAGKQKAPKEMLDLVDDMSDSSGEEDNVMGRVEEGGLKRSARLKNRKS